MNAITFKNLIITEFSLDNTDLNTQSEYINYIGELVVQGIVLHSLPVLNEGQIIELETLIDEEKSSEEVISFLEKNIPNFTEMIKTEVVNIKNELSKSE